MIPQTGKIVVIDDKHDEVKKLLLVLNKKGTSFSYFKGDKKSELPSNPLRGVRLLFLDFVLGTDGQSDKNKISYLMKVLQHSIHTENGPYIILAWTKHDTSQDSLLEQFKQELMQVPNIPKPLAVLNLEKQRCMRNAERISREIENNLNEKEILELLVNWENHAAKAASAVLQILSDVSKPVQQQNQTYEEYSNLWRSEIERHIYRIAESGLGQNIKADRDMLVTAQMALTELFRDNIELYIKEETRQFRPLIQNIASTRPGAYSAEEKAIMNTCFLLISRGIDQKIQPGNIYTLDSISKEMKCENRNCYLNKVKLTRNSVVREFFQGEINEYQHRKDLNKNSIPVMIEITPECDYAQKNWRNAKMLLGIMWPQSVDSSPKGPQKIKKKEFIYRHLTIKYKDNIYYLTFNSQHLHNISFNVLTKINPILRARKELLTDIQYWYSRQMSRPGKTEF